MSLSMDSSLRELLQLVGAISSPKYKQSLTAAVDGRDFNLLLRQAAFKLSGIGVLNFLLEKRDVFEIDLDARGKTSGTALDIALKVKNLEAIKLLQPQVSTFASSITDLQPNISRKNFTNELVFIFTNDKPDVDSLTQYVQTPSSGNLFLGLSGLSALNFVKNGIDYILMVDTSKRVKDFWENIGGIIKNSQNRLDFIKKLKTHLVSNQEKYKISDEKIDYFKSTETLPLFWLKSEYSFNLVSKIFKQGNFAFLQGDLTNVATTRNLKQIFSQYGLTVGAAYFSNLIDCITNFSEYEEALESLLDEHTAIIDTHPLAYKYCEIISRAKEGEVTIASLSEFEKFSENALDSAGKASQRIRNREGGRIKDLYPIMGVMETLAKEEDLFLRFGLKMGYFTEQEIEDNDNFLKEEITRLLQLGRGQEETMQNIQRAIANRLYPGEESSGSGNGSGGGGGGSK